MIKINKKNQSCFVVVTKNVIEKLSFDDIHYFESQGRKICIFTSEKVLYYNGSLEKLKEKLDDRFLSCHGSFLVNLTKVNRLEGSILELEGGITVPISQRKKSTTIKLLKTYLGKHFPCNIEGDIV